jgi:hypothetical protein
MLASHVAWRQHLRCLEYRRNAANRDASRVGRRREIEQVDEDPARWATSQSNRVRDLDADAFSAAHTVLRTNLN